MIKRLVTSFVTLFVLSVVIFIIAHMAEGDPAVIILGETASPEQLSALRESLGLDKPLVMQYIDWISRAVRGDLGVSYFNKNSVTQNISERLSPSLVLASVSQVVAILLAIPMGVLAARHKGRRLDCALSVTAILGMSVPSFLLSLVMMLFFGVTLKWLPVTGFRTISEHGLAVWLRYSIMPVLALGLSHAGLITRMTRSSMIEALKTDYIKTAKAKGVAERVILFKHALRNSFIPVLTAIGQSFGGLLAGTAIIESMFNIPGVGQLIVTSITRRDYPVIQGVVLTVSVVWIIINLLVDFLYGVIDPRIRVAERAA
jgi:peptide/nickel transport system permease protein